MEGFSSALLIVDSRAHFRDNLKTHIAVPTPTGPPPSFPPVGVPHFPNVNVKNVYTGHMRHLEVHILNSVDELDDAYIAGLVDVWEHLLFGPICDSCNQMLLLVKHEKLFIVVDEQNSKILCLTCLTESLGAGILGT